MTKLRQGPFCKENNEEENRGRRHFKITFIFDFIELNLDKTAGAQEVILTQIIPVEPGRTCSTRRKM